MVAEAAVVVGRAGWAVAGSSASAAPVNIGLDATDEHRMTATSRRERIVPTSVVTAARGGDDSALGQLGSASFRRLLAFYRYSGLAPYEAEDLAAETVAVVIGTLGRLRDEEAYDGWMWAIARNKLRGWLRRRRRRDPVEPLSPEAAGPEDSYLLSEEHEGIRLALASLSQRDRELLWLREVEGLSYEEIGGRLGSATGAVRVASHRARKRLEKAFRGENGEEDLPG